MAVVWRHYTGVLYECADIRTMWSGLFQLVLFLVIPLIQYCYNGEAAAKSRFTRVFLCVLSAAPVGAGRFAMGGVCVNVRILQKEKSTGAGI